MSALCPLKPLIASARLLGATLALGAAAQEPPAPPASAMREISPGIYEAGKLRIDQKARTVTLPGVLHLTEGPLEYLLVTERGSSHESLLVSDVEPNQLHFAMLLLGAKGGGATSAEGAPPGPIDAKFLQSAPKLEGERLRITVRWKTGKAEKSTPVEDWIFNADTKKPMERGPWLYNGSRFNYGHFLAQVEGAHAALVTYPSALINNPRRGSDNDQIWTVNAKAVPAAETPVKITIQLLSGPDSNP